MDQVTWFCTKWDQVTWICKIVDQLTWSAQFAQGQITWFLEFEGQVTWIRKIVDQVTWETKCEDQITSTTILQKCAIRRGFDPPSQAFCRRFANDGVLKSPSCANDGV